MKSIIIAFALCLLAQTSAAQTIVGTVTNVIDGDTFSFAGLRVRICGIDAPERHMPGGPEATHALETLISRKQVRCVPVGAGSACDTRSETVNRGRIVAQCFVGGTDVAAAMVGKGFACDWVKFSGGAYPGGCTK